MFMSTSNKTIKYYFFFITKFVYNNNKNAFIELSFFKIITNYSFRITFKELFDSRVKSIFVKTHTKHLNNLIKICKKILLATQKHQKIFIDKYNKLIQFAIENYV